MQVSEYADTQRICQRLIISAIVSAVTHMGCSGDGHIFSRTPRQSDTLPNWVANTCKQSPSSPTGVAKLAWRPLEAGCCWPIQRPGPAKGRGVHWRSRLTRMVIAEWPSLCCCGTARTPDLSSCRLWQRVLRWRSRVTGN